MSNVPATNLTADEWRAKERHHIDKREESYQRCDTDGFVTQYCDGLSADLYRAKAKIVENGGQAEFVGLYDVETGERVKAKIVYVYNKYKYCEEPKWVIEEDPDNKYGRKWIPYDGSHHDKNDEKDGWLHSRSRIQKKAGLIQKLETAPADCKIDSPAGAKGFSGLSQCFIHTFRTDGGYPGAKEVAKRRKEAWKKEKGYA